NDDDPSFDGARTCLVGDIGERATPGAPYDRSRADVSTAGASLLDQRLAVPVFVPGLTRVDDGKPRPVAPKDPAARRRALVEHHNRTDAGTACLNGRGEPGGSRSYDHEIGFLGSTHAARSRNRSGA